MRQPKPRKPIDPAMLAKSGTEHGEQVALFAWCSLPDTQAAYPELRWLYAIPNGGYRDAITAGRLKAEGVKRGVPDTCLPVARKGVHGLYIELKRPSTDAQKAGKLSVDQDRWIDGLRGNGYGACVCVGWEAARDVLISYLTP